MPNKKSAEILITGPKILVTFSRIFLSPIVYCAERMSGKCLDINRKMRMEIFIEGLFMHVTEILTGCKEVIII